MRFVVIRLILFLLLSTLTSSKTLSQIKENMEKVISRLVDRIAYEYEQKCENRIINCNKLSYNMCNGTGERQCFENFPTPEGCLWEGIYLSNNSTVKVPDSITASELSEEQRLFICSTAYAMETFEEEAKKN